MKNVIKQCFTLLLSGILLGCASAPEGTDDAGSATVSRGSDCISQSSVRDYTVLDDANLILSASGRRNYHVVLMRRAFGLRSSWQIGFHSPSGQLCPGFGDLIIDDGFGPERYRIDSIVRLTPEDEEELLIRFGKKDPEPQQTPVPEDVDGAEVEELD